MTFNRAELKMLIISVTKSIAVEKATKKRIEQLKLRAKMLKRVNLPIED